FFFQAEDGIRDRNVTGVQTCALPIWDATENTATPKRQRGREEYSSPTLMEQSKAPESFEMDLRRIVTTTIRASASPTSESRTISRTEGFTVASVTCRSEKFGLISGNDHAIVLDREETAIGLDPDGVLPGRENSRFAVGDDTQHGLMAREDADLAVQGAGDDALGLTDPHLAIGSHDIHFECRHGLLLHLFVVAHDVVETTDVEECLCRNMVDLAGAKLVEALDRVGKRHRRTGNLSELLSGVGVLRQELLDATSTVDDELVLFAEFVDAEDGDDVLQLLVLLQN